MPHIFYEWRDDNPQYKRHISKIIYDPNFLLCLVWAAFFIFFVDDDGRLYELYNGPYLGAPGS